MNKKTTFEFFSELNGVLRDAYSTFWIEFFRKSAEGEESKVPALNSKWQGEEWQVIGMIFTKGFVDQKMFYRYKCHLLQLYLSFLNYISKTERDTLSLALNKDSFEEVFDDLIDL